MCPWDLASPKERLVFHLSFLRGPITWILYSPNGDENHGRITKKSPTKETHILHLGNQNLNFGRFCFPKTIKKLQVSNEENHGCLGCIRGVLLCLIIGIPIKQPVQWKVKLLMVQKSGDHQFRLLVYPIIYRAFYIPPLDPKTMKNEGFRPSIYGSYPPKNEGFGFPWQVIVSLGFLNHQQ